MTNQEYEKKDIELCKIIKLLKSMISIPGINQAGLKNGIDFYRRERGLLYLTVYINGVSYVENQTEVQL